MSYINDALRKAQKDKKLPYAAYETIVSVSGKKTNLSRKWKHIAGIFIVVFCAVVIYNLLHRPEDKKIPAKTLTVSNEQLVVPLNEPVSETPPADSKKEPSLTIKKVEPEMKTGPETTEAKKLYAQALQMHQEGKLEEAKKLYKQVIKLDPRNIEALNNLGVVYMNKKVYKWAIIRLNDALKVKYSYPDAHYNLACIYAQNNDVTRSLSYLKNAIKFNPQVKKWASEDKDLKVLADLPEFKKMTGEEIISR
jgi:tetratricopeptide (TPR) repeat protein